MGVLMVQRVLLAVALLLIFALTLFVGLWFGLTADDATPPAGCVRCFAQFNPTLGQCDEELGEVDEDDCCQNPQYGYQAADGVCRSCGPPLWSPWSPWSQCNVLCGDGVMQRTRKCYGAGECENAADALQIQPCSGSCCDECVRCFAQFNQTLGQCDEELGEVDEDDCCQNPQYGYQAADGVCHSCGPPLWSPWSPWSQCNVLCGDGVMQRTRKCYGAGECENAADALQMQPCSGSCCDAQGWGLWLAWSSCSVTCGGGGVRRRERVCSGPPDCRSACSGPSEETETCPTHSTCPVHGVWSSWSGWSQCSGLCINDQSDDVIVPSRKRHRSCSDPAPSVDTVPPGNRCPGDDVQVQDCSELPNCPVDGRWGAWSPPGPCSVSCGEGIQLSIRKCDNPAPKYGGRFCDGPSAQSSPCPENPCPVDGFWSGWSSWGECSSSCIPQGNTPIRTRRRSCSNPGPSSSPPGRHCEGIHRQTETCDHLPHCPVDGVWGSWSSFSSCPVTCGVGLQESIRLCDSPAPKHGGRPCPGERRQTNICTTNVHCPVDGMWSQWSPWKPCTHPFRDKSINCQLIGGKQTRERECLHQAHNGSICSGEALTETRVCYDVNRCYLKGTWEGWESWSLCSPTCGERSKRFRRRYCKPDYSSYRSTIRGFPAAFFGTPQADCGLPPDGGKKVEVQPCVNAPSCP
ncbi:properdin-like isoform X2 [Sparus aurata]|uniref:properdin-like isoform X2 n=1 Tax=Sparus aurata TaxID=8175 RepID=UPI0011C1C056|nr:properdin-like isoform X2 [Sparus aurata]